MKKFAKILYCFVLLFFLIYSPKIKAANSLDVVINEIAWMGTENSANDEWIELYNPASIGINLDNWVIKNSDEKLKINLAGIIPSKGFYLLERTDDNSVPNITADLIYKGSLKNIGDNLKLYDNSGNLIDEINCSSGWFSGDNSAKKTMERINPLISGNDSSNWQTSKDAGGTPKTENSKGTNPNYQIPMTNQAPNPNEQNEKKPAEVGPPKISPDEDRPSPVYPKGIILSEILPSPEGSDTENEWIEIANLNNFEVDLSNWQIKDKEGKITAYIFPEKTKISSNGFLIFGRPMTKIILNNDRDGLILVQPDGKIIDSVNYEKAPLGKSYNREKENWFWSDILTPGKINTMPVISDKKTKTQSAEVGPLRSSLADEFLIKKQTAKAGEKLSDDLINKKNFYIILIALFLAVSSAVIFLLLKKKLFENN